jgi:hypothetical protein
MAEGDNNQNLTDLKEQAEQARLESEIAESAGLQKKLLEKQLELLKARKKLKEEETLENLKAVQAQEEIVKKTEEEIALREKGLAIGKNYADQIISVNNAILQQSLELGSFSKALGQSVEGFLSKFSSARGVMTMGIDRIAGATKEAVFALDAAGASFVQATGASRDFTTAAFETRNSLGLMGISGADAVETMKGLYSRFSEFSELSRDSQQDFTVLSAQIEKLGGDAAGMAQTFTKVAGMSLAETETAMREVAGAATS